MYMKIRLEGAELFHAETDRKTERHAEANSHFRSSAKARRKDNSITGDNCFKCFKKNSHDFVCSLFIEWRRQYSIEFWGC